MKVRPVDIDIPKHDPFKHDLLDRKETVQALTRLLQNLDSPFTMAVDSPWGNGKTTFLGMWKKHLKTEGFPVVGFNAWETDFAGTPFVALASELLYNLDLLEDSSALNLKTLKNSMQSLCKIFWTTGSAQLISLGGAILSVQQEDPMFGIGGTALAWFTSILTKIGFGTKHQDLPQHPTTYLNVKSEICSFKSELQNVANSLSCKHDHKPLIIAIDKLDRCRPSYAVELLEIAKHFFSVENIVFVLAIDKS